VRRRTLSAGTLRFTSAAAATAATTKNPAPMTNDSLICDWNEKAPKRKPKNTVRPAMKPKSILTLAYCPTRRPTCPGSASAMPMESDRGMNRCIPMELTNRKMSITPKDGVKKPIAISPAQAETCAIRLIFASPSIDSEAMTSAQQARQLPRKLDKGALRGVTLYVSLK
jgi:hypothetical protein